MRDRTGDRGAHSDLHNPAADKAGPSSGGQDIGISEAEAEEDLPVKGPEPERAVGGRGPAGLAEGAGGLWRARR